MIHTWLGRETPRQPSATWNSTMLGRRGCCSHGPGPPSQCHEKTWWFSVGMYLRLDLFVAQMNASSSSLQCSGTQSSSLVECLSLIIMSWYHHNHDMFLAILLSTSVPSMHLLLFTLICGNCQSTVYLSFFYTGISWCLYALRMSCSPLQLQHDQE